MSYLGNITVSRGGTSSSSWQWLLLLFFLGRLTPAWGRGWGNGVVKPRPWLQPGYTHWVTIYPGSLGQPGTGPRNIHQNCLIPRGYGSVICCLINDHLKFVIFIQTILTQFLSEFYLMPCDTKFLSKFRIRPKKIKILPFSSKWAFFIALVANSAIYWLKCTEVIFGRFAVPLQLR